MPEPPPIPPEATPAAPPPTLIDVALAVAAEQIGAREVGHNRGPRVEGYQQSVNMPPGKPWCYAFVHYCYAQAAAQRGLTNPLPRVWAVNKAWRGFPEGARSQHPRRGAIFIRFNKPENPFSPGHCGIVEEVLDDFNIQTIEGNTGGESAPGDPRDREGDGVYRRSRPVSYVNMGFLDIAAMDLDAPAVA